MGDPDYAYKLQAAMKVPLTVTLGPMGSVLRQLHSPELVRLTKKKGVRRFREDIDGLCISLEDVSEADDLSFTAKLWMKEAREILYDTEDCINEVLRPGIAAAPKRLPKTANDLMVRVKDANGRRKRFSLRPVPQPPVVSAVPATDMSVHLDTGGDLDVGSMDKLIPLMALDDETEKELKVVPIYGIAGIGKTTAATTLYRKFSTKFQCRAFLRVSRNPDMRRLLTSLLSQIKAPPDRAFCDVNQLINTINEYLKDKRFFIIIDDLWTTSVWYIIRRAFPDDKCCSRIVTTTQKEDVALACCSYQHGIFMMRPLNYNQSRELLFKRLNCSEGECPTHLKDHLDGIIRRCGGLPLAIVIIASMLASEANPDNIQDLVSTIFGIISEELLSASASSSEVVSPGDFKKIELPVTALTSEGMKGITNLIYNKLPSHLQTCLLYLSMYPEDYPINKADLVKQCLAEGFLCTARLVGEMGIPRGELEETAGRCFDELVNMGMIQPVDTDHDGGVLSYKVGHVVLDLIRCRSMEENFITVLDYFQTTPEELPYDKVRRLSIQSSGAKRARIPASYRTSQIRSLMFCGLLKCVPSVLDYRLLQVVILHIWAEEDSIFDLTGIDTLFRLRYLKVKCNGIMVQLPDKIEGLKYLETLDVPATMDSIPSDIGYLNKLLHLRLVIKDNLRHNIHWTSSLVSLGYFDISSNSTQNVENLGELINLQNLHLTCSTVEPAGNLEEKMKGLGWILGKLINLKSVTLVLAGSSLVKGPGDDVGSSMSISCDGWSWVFPDSAPAHLKRLELLPRVCIFPTLPSWLGGLLQLCILKISVYKLSNKDIDILKGLPALTTLSLSVRTGLAEWIRFDEEGFPVLKYFKFMCIVPYMVFNEGAVRNIRKLKIGFNASRMQPYVLQSVWFKHLRGLEEITAKIGGVGGNISKLESAFVNAISEHPGSPIITVQRVDWVFDCDEEEKSSVSKTTVIAEPQLAPVIQIDIQPVELLPSQQLCIDDTLRLIIKVAVRMIGICGPPGVGKTHFLSEINNSLQGDPLFDVVIFVSASRDCSVQSIQEQITRRLNIVDDGDQISQAHKITSLLRGKSFLVLLDGLCERLDLLAVGIPWELQDQFVQKVVITARSEEIFSRMNVQKVIQVPRLEEDEALKLFEDTVGRRNLYSDPDIGAIAIDLVQELQGVASQLIHFGKKMRGKEGPGRWIDLIHAVKAGKHSNFHKYYNQLSLVGRGGDSGGGANRVTAEPRGSRAGVDIDGRASSKKTRRSKKAIAVALASSPPHVSAATPMQRLFDTSREIFAGSCPGFVPPADAVARLAGLLNDLNPHDVGIDPRMPCFKHTYPIGPPPMTYLHFYGCSKFSFGIFCLPKSAVIPLHNHPGMTVFSKILFGSMHLKSYDWARSNPESDSNTLTTSDGARLAQVNTDAVFDASAETIVLYPESGGNLHRFTALAPCAVLDVMGPPYNRADGRDCAYYDESPYSCTSGGDARYTWLKEIPTTFEIKGIQMPRRFSVPLEQRN